MFIWVVVLVILSAFLVLNWAQFGERLKGGNLWLLIGFSAAALAVWRASIELLHLNQMLALASFILVLGAGYALLQKNNPAKRKAVQHKKQRTRRKRKTKHH